MWMRALVVLLALLIGLMLLWPHLVFPLAASRPYLVSRLLAVGTFILAMLASDSISGTRSTEKLEIYRERIGIQLKSRGSLGCSGLMALRKEARQPCTLRSYVCFRSAICRGDCLAIFLALTAMAFILAT
ncbi:hypothetical protein I7I53_00970 [Histoplasma capsulatum var. duboisii H88]|uniref:Uncharacterized protein n=1 Tax=Ajellomyces capsulatus (strain H88) TaxID=544711 RepID=A0A8A1LM15_AJEC8|nr:hypothetical protein I7I53_00970 [Histoplasma capsulatum var. duboisii H88]